MRGAVVFAAAALAVSLAQGQTVSGPGVSNLDVIQVTTDRFAEQVQEVPNSVEVIGGAELRARGVDDLRTALSLLAGVSVASGGDEGPAAAVPGLLGLREVDDFLLLVDGVPAGGVFIPQFATLSLSNVERIEVQRGSAPVLYGTTAFAGTINVIHYGAGAAEKRINAAYGSFGSIEGDASATVSQGQYRASLGVDGARERYSDPRSGVDRGHLLMRNAADFGSGEARLDFDATLQRQRPASPRPLEGDEFDPDPETPIDFNQNPADAHIDTHRYQVIGAYDRALQGAAWGTTLSLTQTDSRLVQGFLNEDSDPGSGPGNATGFSQSRRLTEAYFDTHLTRPFGTHVEATVGASELYGRAHQDSQTFAYTIDEGPPEPSAAGEVLGSGSLEDWRSLAGVYVQARWNVNPRFGVLAGLRLNRTDEHREEECMSTTRLAGSLGVNWRLWQDPEGDFDDVVVYASYGNTFQPPQIDFGPEAEGPLLPPETAESFEAGVKVDGYDGRFSVDLSLFRVHFANQAVATVVDNTPTLMSGGRERFKGAELEVQWRATQALSVRANYSNSDARYVNFATILDGESVQLAGNQLLLSPHHLAAFGLVYSRPEGLQASLVVNYVGARFLDLQNTISAGSYVTVDATLGYTFHGYAISVNGYNLSNRRDPVLESELGEGQFYLLPGRRIFVKFSVPF